MICHICGKNKSNKGVVFNASRLQRHIMDAHSELVKDTLSEDVLAEDLGLGMTDLLAGDENDGVFWAMAWELGEWF